MNNSHDKFLKDVVSTTFYEIDQTLEPSNFREDWHKAKVSREQKPTFLKQLIPDSFFTIPRSALFNPIVLFLAPVCLMILVIFFLINGTEQSDDFVQPLNSSTHEQLISLDPNKQWQAPTDQLLHIGVRQYETQLITFVNYDPLSMEIK